MDRSASLTFFFGFERPTAFRSLNDLIAAPSEDRTNTGAKLSTSDKNAKLTPYETSTKSLTSGLVTIQADLRAKRARDQRAGGRKSEETRALSLLNFVHLHSGL